MDRPFARLTVTEKAARSLRAGHPWVYEGEVLTGGDPCPDGAVTDVYSPKDRWLGAGFYNSRSKIRVRLLTRNTNDRMDEAFFARRIRYALDYRRRVMGEDYADCRLIFGEADGFPGWTLDRFGDVLVSEVLSLGIEQRKDMLYSLVLRELERAGERVRVLYERSESPIREKEGMSALKGPYAADGLESDPSGRVRIRENGILYDVDYINGQKTGFFLDQKYNRAAAARLAPGMRVLDCFTHTGAFALNCAAAGAERVTAVDVSADALLQAEANARLNSLEDRIDFLRSDVFEYLTALAEKKEHQPAGHAASPPRRVSGDVLVLPLHDRRALPRHALRRGPRRVRVPPADRGTEAEPRSSDPMGRSRDRVSEILAVPDRVSRVSTRLRLFVYN